MFTVTTVNLSPDTTSADPNLGHTELGVLSAAEFVSLLDRFRVLDPRLIHEADPHLLIAAPAGRFLIRTGQGKLFLYNARDNTIPYSELTASEIVAQLDRQLTSPPFPFPAAEPAAAAPHYGIAAAILIAGLALNGYTLYSFFYTESVQETVAVVLLPEGTELVARQREVVGTFATGNQPGDRVITIGPDGTIAFLALGTKDPFANNTDTFRLGRRDKKFCLLTGGSGVVDLIDPDTLRYYRDTYRRTR